MLSQQRKYVVPLPVPTRGAGGALFSVLLLLPCIGQAAEDPTALGFRQLLRATLAGPAVRVARMEVDAASAEVSKATSALLPSLNASGSFTHSSVEAVFDQAGLIRGVASTLGLPIPPNAAFGDPIVVQPQNQLVGAVTLSQTFFHLAVLRAPQVAIASRKAARATAEATEDDLLFQVSSLYATAVGLKGTIRALQKGADVYAQRETIAKARFDAGAETQLAVSRARSERLAAESEVLKTEQQLFEVEHQIQVLVGFDERPKLADELLSPHLNQTDHAVNERQSLIAKRRELEAAELAVGLTSANWMPIVTAQAQAQFFNFEGFAGARQIGSGTINLVLPLYDGGTRYAETEKARVRVRQAEEALRMETLAAKAFRENARSEVLSKKQELAFARSQRDLARESLGQAEALYEAGAITSLELADADTRKLSAEQVLVQKETAHELSLLKLYYAQGGRLRALIATPSRPTSAPSSLTGDERN